MSNRLRLHISELRVGLRASVFLGILTDLSLSWGRSESTAGRAQALLPANLSLIPGIIAIQSPEHHRVWPQNKKINKKSIPAPSLP